MDLVLGTLLIFDGRQTLKGCGKLHNSKNMCYLVQNDPKPCHTDRDHLLCPLWTPRLISWVISLQVQEDELIFSPCCHTAWIFIPVRKRLKEKMRGAADFFFCPDPRSWSFLYSGSVKPTSSCITATVNNSIFLPTEKTNATSAAF